MRYLLCSLGILACAGFLGCSDTKTVEEVHDVYTDRYTVDKEGKKHGEFRRYFGSDTLSEISHYDHGLLEGERTIYAADGKPEIVETYKDDTLHGPYTVYHENGDVRVSGNYDHGVMRGVWKRYFVGGQVLEEVTYENNLENGPFTEYHESGTIKAKGTYKEGDYEQDTLWLYDTEGELFRKMLCDHGICHTVWPKDSITVYQ